MTLHHGDCLDVLSTIPDNSVDSIVTDPPYGLSFMGKKWDYDVPSEDIWRECLRVLKPGGHLLAFAGTRTQHRMAVRIEDAGFEIRDMIAWVYGSGFPKSLDVSKAIDKAAGAEREKKRHKSRPETCGTMSGTCDTRPWIEESREKGYHEVAGDTPVTLAAAQWDGWGTALKPALEPITLARKPLEGTVAANVLKWHTGALNIGACRVEHASEADRASATPQGKVTAKSGALAGKTQHDGYRAEFDRPDTSKGRWPANLIHDGSDEVVGLFPQSSAGKTGKATIPSNPIKLQSSHTVNHVGHNDSGSAARFFYCAKASKKDRDEGCEGLEERVAGVGDVDESSGRDSTKPGNQYGEGSRNRVEAGLSPTIPRRNHHPTVKPTALMRYLCRLVTPPEGIVLDPFMGSGSTGKAAMLEGFQFVGIERDAEYFEIAKSRIKQPDQPKQPELFQP